MKERIEIYSMNKPYSSSRDQWLKRKIEQEVHRRVKGYLDAAMWVTGTIGGLLVYAGVSTIDLNGSFETGLTVAFIGVMVMLLSYGVHVWTK